MGFLGAEVVPSEGSLISGGIQAIIIYVEIFVGAWLFLPGQVWEKWLAVVGLLISFLAVNLAFSWEGRASCGCFGPMKTDPRFVAALEFFLLVVFLICRPAVLFPRIVRCEWCSLSSVSVALVCLGVALALGVMAFGTLDRATAFLANKTYSIAPGNINLGVSSQGDIREADVHISNWSARPLRVVGGTSTCSCLTTSDLPCTIEPGETATLRIKIRFPDSEGRSQHLAKFILDADGWQEVPFQVAGYAGP